MKERLEYINDLAEMLQEELKLNCPVNVEDAVTKLGGKIADAPLDIVGADAKIIACKIGDTEFEITLNTKVSNTENQKRLTIAHELGHLFLHMKYHDEEYWNALKSGDSEESAYIDGAYYRFGYSEEEREANQFAGAFLMPRKIFFNIATENLSDGLYLINPIARFFEVPLDAAKMRGRYLKLFGWED